MARARVRTIDELTPAAMKKLQAARVARLVRIKEAREEIKRAIVGKKNAPKAVRHPDPPYVAPVPVAPAVPTRRRGART